jgi:hypothetical protein
MSETGINFPEPRCQYVVLSTCISSSSSHCTAGTPDSLAATKATAATDSLISGGGEVSSSSLLLFIMVMLLVGSVAISRMLPYCTQITVLYENHSQCAPSRLSVVFSFVC